MFRLSPCDQSLVGYWPENTFSNSRSSLKKKAAFCDCNSFERSSSGDTPGGSVADTVTAVEGLSFTLFRRFFMNFFNPL